MVLMHSLTPARSKSFMQPRQSTVEIFSTFIKFDSDRFGGWITDATLRRSIQTCLKQTPQSPSQASPEQFWALYWHKQWQMEPSNLTTTNQATAHISAYLQEVCYWVAKKMATNLANRQSVADLFQTAIARIHRVIQGFNPQLSSNLKSYAEFAFSNIIKDSLRKRREADICTDWALLQKVSQKRLVTALNHRGLDHQTIAAYILAWHCFRELYSPSLQPSSEVRSTRKLGKPETATWQAIATLYNSERMGRLDPAGRACSPEQLEQWMFACAKAIRAFLYPQPLSIDAPVASEDSSSLIDLLPGEEQESLLTNLISQEELSTRQTQQAEVGQVLIGAIADLDPQTQQLLQSYYGQELTQQQIAQTLDIKQYTVSRRLTSTRQTLLKKLVHWSQETLHISLTTDVLSGMSTVLDEWLHTHYRPAEPSSPEYL
jgi:RNA polymerase sigma factor (sigma-70 family)